MNTPALSIRLPGEIRERLEQAALRTNRSRSFLVQEALTRHLDDIMREQGASETQSRLERLRALKGAGARIYGPLSAEQIDADIREFRSDE
ncbi:TraY domain-containing protein [Pararhodospirillum photometricum]|uniref:TraY domain-containing protein n=1 Tax=Pararhodospirillum photometricum TaxID=1084 RepID=UPI0012FE8A07|nr:TraY domain-containing protein [Pararhodospirillum photometricum]